MKTPFYAAICLLFFVPMTMQVGAQTGDPNPKVVNCPVFAFEDIKGTEKNDKGIYILKTKNNDGTYNYTIKMSKSSAVGTEVATAKLKVKGKLKTYLDNQIISASNLSVSPPTISNLDPADGPFIATIYEVKLNNDDYQLGDKGYSDCPQTITFDFGCASCTCTTASSEIPVIDSTGRTGSSNSTTFMKYSMGVGTAFGGDSTAELTYRSNNVENVGPVGLFIPAATGYEIIRDSNAVIRQVRTDRFEAIVTDVTSAVDPKAFKIEFKYRLGASAGDVFKTVNFENVSVNGKVPLRLTSAITNGQTEVFEMGSTIDQQETGGYDTKTSLTKAGGEWETILYKKENADGAGRVEKEIVMHKDLSGNPVVQSVQKNEYTYYPEGERLTRQTVDPDGAGLVTIWEYYQIGEPTGPNGSSVGQGKLKRMVSPNGSETIYTYESQKETTVSSYAGNSQGETTVVETDPLTGTTTTTRSVGQTMVAKTVQIRVDDTTTNRVYTGASNYLQTVTERYPIGADFGGQTKKITHPNGTVSIYEYSRAGGSKITKTYSGVPGGANISEGTKTERTINSQGKEESEITTAVGTGDGTVLSHMVVLDADDHGRPLSIGHFPNGSGGYAYTTSMTYSCCGVATETDQYGITTTYAHDDLKRVVKTNRLGITIARVYDGLTVNTHRYNETAAEAAIPNLSDATATNLIARSVTNIAGTVVGSWSRSAADGTLIRDSLTTITYLNPESETPASLPTGIGQRQVILTVDGFTQTTDFYKDGKTYETFGDLKSAMRYSYGVNATGEFTSQSFVDGTNLRETTTTQSDLAGRTMRMDYMDGAFSTMEYNSLGQMEKSTDPDGVTTLMAYNDEGEQIINAVDLNANGVIDYGVDTVSASYNEPATEAGKSGQQSISKVWQPGDTNPTGGTVTNSSFNSSDGLYSSNQQIGVANTSISLTALSGNGNWTTTSIAPDGTKSLSTYTAGRMVSMASLDTTNAVIESQTQAYDTLNRPITSTHSRTGVSTTNYLSTTADIVASVSDSGGRTTAFIYDVRGRQISVNAPDTLDADGNTLTNTTTTTYNPDSNVAETNGDQTYRVSHTYDYADRQISMTTYGTVTATTTWQYSTTRGFLLAKRDASNKGVNYTYKPSGRLATRTWARGKHTRYDYDLGGRLTNTHYFTAANDDDGSNAGNDAVTPSISMAYDALGRQTTQSNGIATSTFAYNVDNLQIDTETITYNLPGKPAFTRVIDRSQDNLSRESGWTLGESMSTSAFENEVAYNYGASDGRLASVNKGSNSFSYLYAPNSSLIASVTSPAHTVSNVYETTRDVLASKVNKKLDTTTISGYFYTVNNFGQRTGVNKDGTAFASTRNITWGYNSKGEIVKADSSEAGLDRAYQYDGIGNRISGGDVSSPISYTANALNQYSAISSLNPVHDDDGNMTSGPLPANVNANSTLVWDAENRLIEAQVNGGATVIYFYDSQSRRIAETVGIATTVYVYDGWNPIAEYSTSFALTKTYAWGIDLSGSMQGAGGVGGLLSVTDSTGTYFPTFDGNGNVSEYLDSNGNTVAHYEYDPFGKTTVSNGSKASDFAHRFSTKPLDLTTGLYYYGYRYYDPETGRWSSRDPIQERGGVNLYGFVGNDGVGMIDVLGMEMATYHFGEAKVTEDSWVATAKDNDPSNDDVIGTTKYDPFPRVTKCDGCQLIVFDVKLDIEIILYNQDEKFEPRKPDPGVLVLPSSYEKYMERFNKGDDFGNTVLGHEQIHEYYAMEEWNKAAGLVNLFGSLGPDITPYCCEMKSAYLNAYVKYRGAEADVKHAIFDFLAYGKSNKATGNQSGSNENIIDAKRLSDIYFNDMEAKKRIAEDCYKWD